MLCVAGLARKAMHCATSEASTSLPVGVRERTSFKASGLEKSCWVIGVAANVGATAFTVMPNRAHSRASVFVRASSFDPLAQGKALDGFNVRSESDSGVPRYVHPPVAIQLCAGVKELIHERIPRRVPLHQKAVVE